MDSFDQFAGMRGWQWMFLIEAVPAVLLGILVLFFLNNGIRLTEEFGSPRRRSSCWSAISKPTPAARRRVPTHWVECSRTTACG
jgi:MFS family permease